MSPKKPETFIEKHGRPFLAMWISFGANAMLVVSVYIKSMVLHRLDLPTLVIATTGMTAVAGIYLGGAAWVKGKEADASTYTETE